MTISICCTLLFPFTLAHAAPVPKKGAPEAKDPISVLKVDMYFAILNNPDAVKILKCPDETVTKLMEAKKECQEQIESRQQKLETE